MKTSRILAPVLVAVFGAGCIAPELIPMDRASYRAALIEPVWNAVPVDPVDLANEFSVNAAAAGMKYERKRIRFRGITNGVISSSGVAAVDVGWGLGIASETHHREADAMMCTGLSREEAASYTTGQPILVVAEVLGGSGGRFNVGRCTFEAVTAETPRAVAPSKAGVSPDYRPTR